MLDAIATPTGFFILLCLFGLAAGGSLLRHGHDTFSNKWSNGIAIAGAIWGTLFAISVLVTGRQITSTFAASSFPLFSIAFRVDQLAAFFIGLISFITLLCSTYGLGYVKEYYKRYNIGALGFFYNAFILGMLLVVTAANGLWFLVAWEIMSLTSYFLVVYDRHDRQNVKAGYLYLAMAQLGAACILAALALLFKYAHSFDFAVIQAQVHIVPKLALMAVFCLLTVGFGIKAGVIPLHIWLPSAHPAAPSHVSALMSGVMIKMGIYVMIRMFLQVLQPVPLWWGLAVLALGAVSSLVGVLYALTEHDIKRLLAYHSIENIGIILLGIGSAMVFTSLHQPALVLVSLAAALFHTLNHATFKSLLFLSAGSVVRATHTRNIEKYGGLLKLLPATGLFFLIGSMAISALPPFNGFFSEWLTFQSLFGGAVRSGTYVHWVFLAGAASLAITGGLALACFVKAFGVTFLARPRSDAAKKAAEASLSMKLGMSGLAIACLAIGVFSGQVTHVLQYVSRSVTGIASASAAVSSPQTLAVGHPASSVTGPLIFLLLLFVPVGVWFGTKYGVYRRQKVTTSGTWDCGTPLNGRMEITATGFSHSIVRIFGVILQPKIHHRVEQSASTNPSHLSSRAVSMHVRDVYQAWLYQPFYRVLLMASRAVKRVQNGNLNTYILYIFVAIVVTILVGV